MRIERLDIDNFRVFEKETVSLGNYTCLAGPNGAGKSTILTALNIFFRQTADANTDLMSLEEEDFHQKDTSRPIRITLTFTDLSEEAKKDLSDYVRQDKLIVSAVASWDEATRRATVKQFGSRLGMKKFAPWFKAFNDGAKSAELKDLYGKIRKQCSALAKNAKTKRAMRQELDDYEGAHPELHSRLESEDQWYGISRGRLDKYLQWVYVPAVKDVTTEEIENKKTALGALLERTVREKVSFDEPLEELRQNAVTEYKKLLAENQPALRELSESLTGRLHDWAHPDTKLVLQWHSDSLKSVTMADPLAEIIAGEGPFTGKLARFGHGLQRSFLLAILQELASIRAIKGPTLVLAIEEPELYQHPPQARHLATVLNGLAARDSQVLVCTHSPMFITGQGFEDVRIVRKESRGKRSVVRSVTFQEVAAGVAAVTGKAPVKELGTAIKVHQVLQPSINEMFFTSVLVLVEGLEDLAYITAYLELTDRTEEFRRLGCHVVPMPTDGKSYIVQPLVIAKRLGIPTFVVFDSDAHAIPEPDPNGTRQKHENDNNAILRLCGVKKPNPLPTNHYWGKNVVMWASEIGRVAADDYGPTWNQLKDRVLAKHGIVGVGGLAKSSLFIGYVLAEAWDEGKRFASLEGLCESLLAFARVSQRGDSARKRARAR